jgi:hypothetical protein
MNGNPPAPRCSPRAAREVEQNTPLRRARTCYGHLAGVAGVHLLRELLRRGWLEPDAGGPSPAFRLTAMGEAALCARGVDLAAACAQHRPLAQPCRDWTEREYHLAGPLGDELVRALAAAGVIARRPDTRIVTLVRPLDPWLDG